MIRSWSRNLEHFHPPLPEGRSLDSGRGRTFSTMWPHHEELFVGGELLSLSCDASRVIRSRGASETALRCFLLIIWAFSMRASCHQLIYNHTHGLEAGKPQKGGVDLAVDIRWNSFLPAVDPSPADSGNLHLRSPLTSIFLDYHRAGRTGTLSIILSPKGTELL